MNLESDLTIRLMISANWCPTNPDFAGFGFVANETIPYHYFGSRIFSPISILLTMKHDQSRNSRVAILWEMTKPTAFLKTPAKFYNKTRKQSSQISWQVKIHLKSSKKLKLKYTKFIRGHGRSFRLIKTSRKRKFNR